MGALPGGVGEAPSVLAGKLSAAEFGKRRARDAGRAGVGHVAMRQAARMGKATEGTLAHVQRGGRLAAVAAVMGAVDDVGPLARRELCFREFAGNRGFDCAEVGGEYGAHALALAVVAAAPGEAPAFGTAALGLGVRTLAAFGIRRVRRRVANAQRRQELTSGPEPSSAAAAPTTLAAGRPPAP
jgi:hypothetical protein